MKISVSQADRWAGPLLALLAFILYVATMSWVPVAGTSSSYLATYIGVDSIAPLTHTLWGLVVRVAHAIPFGGLAFKVHLFNAIFGAIGIWFFYRLMTIFRFHPQPASLAPEIPVLAGVAGGLALCTAIPYWIVSNRAHPYALSLFIFFGVLLLLNKYAQSGRLKDFCLFCVLYGVGATEYHTFIALGPLMGLIVAILLYRKGQFKLGILLLGLLCLVGGLLFYFVAAIQFQMKPAAQWFEIYNLPKTIYYIWVEQWTQIARSVPELGWLVLMLVSLVPFCAALLICRQSYRRTKYGSIILMMVLTGLMAYLLWDGPALSPWQLSRQMPRQPILVMVYVLIAATVGLVVAFWFMIRHWLRRKEVAKSSQEAILRPSALVVLAITGLTFSIIAVRNSQTVQSRAARPLYTAAQDLVDQMGRRDWLINADRGSDSLIQLAALEKGKPITILNTTRSNKKFYRNYVASRFEVPRLQGLAQVGLVPMAKEWFLESPTIEDQVGALGIPDVWWTTSKVAVPHKTFYRGEQFLNALDADLVFEENMEYWQKRDEDRLIMKKANQMLKPFTKNFLREQSRMVNDLGVLMEELERSDLAMQAYRYALTMEEKNASALLNLAALLDDESTAEEAAALRAEALTQIQHGEYFMSVAQIVRLYGHLRTAKAIQVVREGYKELIEAHTEMEEQLKELDLITKDYISDPKTTYARVKKFVKENPKLDTGWVLLAKLALAQGDELTFDSCVSEMNNRNKNWPKLLEILGQRALKKGELESAEKYYRRALSSSPGNMDFTEVLLTLQMQKENYASARDFIKAILTVDPGNARANMALGTINYEAREFAWAISSFKKSVERHPTAAALNNLAWTLHKLGQYKEALSYIQQSVELNKNSAESWDTLCVVLFSLDRFEEALEAVNEALRLDADSLDAMLHKARLLVAREDGDKALALTNKVIERQEELSELQYEELRDLVNQARML